MRSTTDLTTPPRGVGRAGLVLLTVLATATSMLLLLASTTAAHAEDAPCEPALVTFTPAGSTGFDAAVALTAQALDRDVDGWITVAWEADPATDLTALTITAIDGTVTTRTEDIGAGTALDAVELRFCGTTTLGDDPDGAEDTDEGDDAADEPTEQDPPEQDTPAADAEAAPEQDTPAPDADDTDGEVTDGTDDDAGAPEDDPGTDAPEDAPATSTPDEEPEASAPDSGRADSSGTGTGAGSPDASGSTSADDSAADATAPDAAADAADDDAAPDDPATNGDAAAPDTEGDMADQDTDTDTADQDTSTAAPDTEVLGVQVSAEDQPGATRSWPAVAAVLLGLLALTAGAVLWTRARTG